MAIKRYVIDGFGQLEINNCAFRRDGRIEAQCAPNTTDFATAKVENGMLLAVDAVNREVKFSTDSVLPVALVYTAEHMYDERKDGLKDFALNGTDDFLPRLGYPAVGDKFTTNCLCYDSAVYANDSAVNSALESCKAAAVYGGKSSVGAIALSSTAPTVGPVLKVVEKTTMPDGQPAVKFQVLSV